MDPEELTELALAAGGGDPTALAAFTRATHPQVWRFCAHLAGVDRADDLAQDVFVRALRALPRFRGTSSATTWLFGIAKVAVADDRRRSWRRQRTARAAPPKPEATTPGGAVDLAQLVAALEPARRLAFVLTQVSGLSYAEAAEVCGCPVGTIRSRVARARGDLVAATRVAESDA